MSWIRWWMAEFIFESRPKTVSHVGVMFAFRKKLSSGALVYVIRYIIVRNVCNTLLRALRLPVPDNRGGILL